MTVTDYHLAYIDEVVDCLKDGWYLYGSPMILSDGRPVQAMVKYLDENADIRIKS